MPVSGKIIGWVREFPLNWLNIQFAQGQSDNLCHICVLIQLSAELWTWVQTSCMLVCSLVCRTGDGKDCLLILGQKFFRQNKFSQESGGRLTCFRYITISMPA
ncbi:uncharacterized protein TNCT_497081 [Trichonephila clavata]|uniref:Uncharacterized protein n=1 Tax=Trichonephila clavata TaxID=2740835 RepID=A0A8X6KZI8_TRICU|nr:uncharacterized protein TNCT_497081 [Trichonephila clavata]